MLKKLYRFHGHSSLNFVHSAGKSVRAGSFQLKFCHNKRRKDNRLAVVVSKKVVKSSPKRNRIRRRSFETFRQQWPLMKAPYDLVLTVFDDRVLTLSSVELNKVVVELIAKANLYKD